MENDIGGVRNISNKILERTIQFKKEQDSRMTQNTNTREYLGCSMDINRFLERDLVPKDYLGCKCNDSHS